MKKKFILLFSAVLLLGSVLAVWLIDFRGTTGFSISGSKDITFTDNMSVSYVNISGVELQKTEFIWIENSGSDKVFTLKMDTISQDVLDECNISEKDYNVSLFYNSEMITGDEITLLSGSSIIEVQTTLDKYACPQEVSTDIHLFLE
jgi:hypothetical protein